MVQSLEDRFCGLCQAIVWRDELTAVLNGISPNDECCSADCGQRRTMTETASARHALSASTWCTTQKIVSADCVKQQSADKSSQLYSMLLSPMYVVVLTRAKQKQ